MIRSVPRNYLRNISPACARPLVREVQIGRVVFMVNEREQALSLIECIGDLALVEDSEADCWTEWTTTRPGR